VWLILAGRGFGKTRAAAEWIGAVARATPRGRFALVGATLDDVRDTMVEGESGLLSVLPASALRDRDEDGAWNRVKCELWLANGARFKGFSSERARKLRGPQHHAAWCDEASSWADAKEGTTKDTTWSNLLFGLRLGADPRIVVTTTPKPNRLTRELVKLPGVVVTGGSTYDNLGNLSARFRANVVSRYEGTSLGRQELHAVLLDEAPGALWTRALLDASRGPVDVDALTRIVVGLDPTSGDGSGDVCGIVGAGRTADGRGVVLRDASLRGGPTAWARAAVRLYHRLGANEIVAEGNQGGELVREVIRSVDAGVPVRIVYASHGKAARAEPVVALYEQGKVTHADGEDLDALADELVGWVPGKGESPGRLDALVWALTALLVRGGGEAGVEVL
jgi:phage terminase large subunit-like protein